jgi:hypothetical protein
MHLPIIPFQWRLAANNLKEASRRAANRLSKPPVRLSPYQGYLLRFASGD